MPSEMLELEQTAANSDPSTERPFQLRGFRHFSQPFPHTLMSYLFATLSRNCAREGSYALPMKLTSEWYCFFAATGLISRSAADGRNFAGSPSALHSASKPETKKVSVSFPTATMWATSGRYVLLYHCGSWYHIEFGLPSMIVATVSRSSPWHLPRITKSGLNRRACDSAHLCVSLRPMIRAARLSSMT